MTDQFNKDYAHKSPRLPRRTDAIVNTLALIGLLGFVSAMIVALLAAWIWA